MTTPEFESAYALFRIEEAKKLLLPIMESPALAGKRLDVVISELRNIEQMLHKSFDVTEVEKSNFTESDAISFIQNRENDEHQD